MNRFQKALSMHAAVFAHLESRSPADTAYGGTMSASLQILQDDLIKLWSEIGMSQIAMAIGLLFCMVILKMKLDKVDRRDFITELMYVGYITFAFLTLLVVVPDLMRPQSSPETMLLMTVIAVFVAFIRWNSKDRKTYETANETMKAGPRNV